MFPGRRRCPAGACLYARSLNAMDEYGKLVGFGSVLGGTNDESAVNREDCQPWKVGEQKDCYKTLVMLPHSDICSLLSARVEK